MFLEFRFTGANRFYNELFNSSLALALCWAWAIVNQSRKCNKKRAKSLCSEQACASKMKPNAHPISYDTRKTAAFIAQVSEYDVMACSKVCSYSEISCCYGVIYKFIVTLWWMSFSCTLCETKAYHGWFICAITIICIKLRVSLQRIFRISDARSDADCCVLKHCCINWERLAWSTLFESCVAYHHIWLMMLPLFSNVLITLLKYWNNPLW